MDKNNYRKFPYEIKPVEKEVNKELLKNFTGEKTGFVQVGPEKWLFPRRYLQEAEPIYNFKVRPDDVFIVTFPRSGTTITQEMIWMLSNNMDFQKGLEIPLIQRFPFLEVSLAIHPEVKNFLLENLENDPIKKSKIQSIGKPMWHVLDKIPEKRYIKTHLPFSVLPPDLLTTGCKIIYVARNPKDVIVSYYHFCRTNTLFGYNAGFNEFYDYFEKNLVQYSPYWQHIKEGWSKRHEKNLLFLFYEDINKDLRKYIKRAANFLDKSYTNEELDKLEDHLKIKNFRHNKSVNLEDFISTGIFSNNEAPFIRNGLNGGWKNYFDQDLEKRVDAWIKQNLNGTDIAFPL